MTPKKTSLAFIELPARKTLEKSQCTMQHNIELMSRCATEIGGWTDLSDDNPNTPLKAGFDYVLQLKEVPENSAEPGKLLKEYYRNDYPLSLTFFFQAAREKANKMASKMVSE